MTVNEVEQGGGGLERSWQGRNLIIKPVQPPLMLLLLANPFPKIILSLASL